jgi:hypothetical protein
MDTVPLGRSCAGPVPAGSCYQCGGRARRGDRVCSPECRRAWADAHVWTSARILALARAGYACELCGALDYDTVLHVHHDPPLERPEDHGRPGCHHHPERLHVLCAQCHYRVHRWLRSKPGDQLVLVA